VQIASVSLVKFEGIVPDRWARMACTTGFASEYLWVANSCSSGDR
jgi:hypothetical protein